MHVSCNSCVTFLFRKKKLNPAWSIWFNYNNPNAKQVKLTLKLRCSYRNNVTFLHVSCISSGQKKNKLLINTFVKHESGSVTLLTAEKNILIDTTCKGNRKVAGNHESSLIFRIHVLVSSACQA